MAHLAAPLAMPEAEIVLRAPAGVALPKVETIWFDTPDGLALNFKRLRPVPGTPDRGPVLLVHGSGVRANLFCPPSTITLPAMLSADGFDVWMLNWRASIDVQPSEYTFDDAAVHDFPVATGEILTRTGCTTLKAVVHCQGSHAFMMSMMAGRLPEYTRVVANSTALHPRIRRSAAIKLPIALATLGRTVDYFNPQYGLHAPRVFPRLMDWMVRSTHHECRNPVCKHASFVYGVGFPNMWNHENLDEITHDWIKGEFAHVPVSLFRQTRACLTAGHLVSTGKYRDLPTEFGVGPPHPEVRAVFKFITGGDNRTFRPDGMFTTWRYFERYAPGVHTFEQFPGYGHLDMFLGQYAALDVFPTIIDWLKGGSGGEDDSRR
ncbi:alpha/beta hydrolase [Mycolicibacterium thermoresistibile]